MAPKGVTPPFSNPFARKKVQDIIGVDLNEEHIKIAYVHLSQLRREVVQLVGHEVRGMADDDVAGFLQKTVQSFKLKEPSAYLTVPLHVVITRTIEIPSKDPREIREIVNLQASRHTPYSRAEIIVDMMNLGIVRDNYTKVLLVIVPKDVVARQIHIVESAGLNTQKVFFAPEGIAQASSKILGNEHNDTVTAIVHMDAGFTTFEVIQRSKILFIRGISIGANHLLDEREIYTDRFVDELQKSLDSYVNDELGPMPSTLLLTGVVADVTELDELFNETLRIPLKHQTYFNYFAISAAAKKAAAESKRVSFFNLVAPLLLYDRMKLDLISDERKLKLELQERGRQMVRTGFLVMTFLSLVFAIFLEQIFFKNVYLEKLAKRYEPARREAQSLEALFAKTRAIKEVLASRGDSIETLTELYDTLPRDVRVTQVKYEEGEKFTVRGTSATMASVFSFVTNLERSDKFKSVKTKYVTSRNEGGADVADFEILALIKPKAVAA